MTATASRLVDIWGKDKTPVYKWNKDAAASGKYTIINNQGGTYSGKTIGIIKVLIDLAIENPGWVITITSKDSPKLKGDTLREFTKLLYKPNIAFFFENPELKEGPFILKNKSIIEFRCFQSMEDAESGKRDVLYANEAYAIHWDIFKTLKKKTNFLTFVDYNPTARFWMHDELMHKPECKTIVSTFLDNPFCLESKKREILGYMGEYLRTKSSYWLNEWRVYGQGKTGMVEGLVFPIVRKMSVFPDNEFLQPFNVKGVQGYYGYGLDFGFSSHMTAICKGGIRRELGSPYNGRFVGQQIMYEPFNEFDLPKKLPELGITKNDLIIADSAGRAAIEVMQRLGYKIFPAVKDPGSVKEGIQLLNKQGIDLIDGSEDWFLEQKKYMYEKRLGRYDPDIPKKQFDDLWDSARYLDMAITGGFGVRKVQRQGRRRVSIV